MSCLGGLSPLGNQFAILKYSIFVSPESFKSLLNYLLLKKTKLFSVLINIYIFLSEGTYQLNYCCPPPLKSRRKERKILGGT